MCLREAARPTAGLGRDDIIQAQASSCSNMSRPGCPAQGNSSPCQGCVLLLVGRSPDTPAEGHRPCASPPLSTETGMAPVSSAAVLVTAPSRA